MKFLPFLFLISIFGYSQQDTVKLDEVRVHGQANSLILNKIQKNFKKNFSETEKIYALILQTNCNNQRLFSVSETNVPFGKKNVEKRTFPETIESKLKTDEFSNREIDEFHSPVFLATKVSLRYVKLDSYIKDVKIEKIEPFEEDFLDIFGTYNTHIVEIRVEIPSLNVVSVKLTTPNPVYDKSTSLTKGTSKYTNSTSSYHLTQTITINYFTENQKIYLKYFSNDMKISDYTVQLFNKNEQNDLVKEYVFDIASSLQIKKLN